MVTWKKDGQCEPKPSRVMNTMFILEHPMSLYNASLEAGLEASLEGQLIVGKHDPKSHKTFECQRKGRAWCCSLINSKVYHSESVPKMTQVVITWANVGRLRGKAQGDTQTSHASCSRLSLPTISLGAAYNSKTDGCVGEGHTCRPF